MATASRGVLYATPGLIVKWCLPLVPELPRETDCERRCGIVKGRRGEEARGAQGGGGGGGAGISLCKITKPLWLNYKVKYKKEAYVFLRSFCTSSYRPQVYTCNPNFNMRHKCLSALSKGLSPSVHLVLVSVADFVLTLYFLYFCRPQTPEVQDCTFAQACHKPQVER